MRFLDCNCFIGPPRQGHLKPVRTAGELLAAMDRSGIEKAVAWYRAQLPVR